MNVPQVSAVIPTRNRSELVKRAVRSALNQTLRDIEVIVVIDGPDEATEMSLASIEDGRLRVIALTESVGGSEARNVGVRASLAPWAALLDDDDEWMPEKLEIQLRAALALNVPSPIVYCRFIGRGTGGDTIMAARLPADGEEVSDYLFCRRGLRIGETGLGSSELFASRQLLIDVPFQRGLRRHQDWDWVLRAVRRPDARLHVVPEVLAIYYMQTGEQRLSVNDEWQFSLDWARERRHLLTQKAYSFFIATECVPRAKKAGAGTMVFWTLISEFVHRGSPRWNSALLLVGFVILPAWLKSRLRRRRK